MIFVAPLKFFILVVLNPTSVTVPIKLSTSMVSPTSYSPSVIIENPAIKSFAKSWNASPIIAVPIPTPARIDLILTPNCDNIANITKTIIIYLIIFNINNFIVLILCTCDSLIICKLYFYFVIFDCYFCS